MINTDQHLDRLLKVADRFGVTLELVPSIQSWCRENRLPEAGPFCAGIAVQTHQTGKFRVLLANPITNVMASTALEAMGLSGHSDAELNFLAPPERFVDHLLLHEIAHTLDPAQSEQACNRWASEQMGYSET